MNRSTVLAVGLLLLGNGLASAQTPPANPKQPNPIGPKAGATTNCAPAGATTGSNGQSDTLSNRLAQSNGVICPPATSDPGMQVAPPQGGALKVLPPPGTPGGDPKTVPK
ncbi:MAG TPA: hypothetical protein VGG01_14135 [Xanthobacteraceae bacterium]